MSAVTTEVASPEELQWVLDGVYRDIERQYESLEFSPVWSEVIADLETLHDKYFLAEKGPAGKWEELAEETVFRKGHEGILWETKRLQASLIGQTADSIREVISEEHNSGFVFGTEVEYAHYHMTGTQNMPARPMVGITEVEVDAIVNRMLDYTTQELVDGYG